MYILRGAREGGRSFSIFQRLAYDMLVWRFQEDKLMLIRSRMALILGLAGAMAGLPSLAVAQKNSSGEAGVQEAIRSQKAEDAAAARQARIEEAKARGQNSADRAVTPAKKKDHPRQTP